MKIDITDDQINEFANELKREEEEKRVRISEFDFGLLKKAIGYLKINSVIDDEDILYFPEQYPITEKEFCKVIEWLESKAPKDYESDPKYDHSCEFFPIHHLFFEHKGEKIIFRKMYGQGTAHQLYGNNNDRDIKFEEDKKIILKDEECRL